MKSARDKSADATRANMWARPLLTACPSLHPVIAPQSTPLISTLLCHPCGGSRRHGGPQMGGVVWPRRRIADVIGKPYSHSSAAQDGWANNQIMSKSA